MTEYDEAFRRKVIEDYYASGLSIKKIASKYNIGCSSVERWKAKYDLAKENDEYIPEGHNLKKASTLYDENGEVKLRWVSTSPDEIKKKEAEAAAIEALKKEIPRLAPIDYTSQNNKNLLSLYVLTDYHFGMMAWEQEGGDNWDLKIASDLLEKWFSSAVAQAPDSHTAVLANIGDLMHYDALEAITPTSGHVLDADSRLPKVIDVVIKTIRKVIDMLLHKHQHVHIVMAEGNHDLASSVWLRAMFSALYEDEPRITVDNTHIPFYMYEWGDVSLFFHHGHKKRLNQVSEFFAGNFREVFGKTQFSYAHMGHLHHKEVKENSLMIVEQHRTLAAKDAHAIRGAYLSGRGASVITYNKNYGEVGRNIITPEMVYT